MENMIRLSSTESEKNKGVKQSAVLQELKIPKETSMITKYSAKIWEHALEQICHYDQLSVSYLPVYSCYLEKGF